AALNRVRVRAQLPEISSLTLQNIIDERRAELFSENERWFDIIRWRIADKVLANAGTHRYSFLGYKEGTKEYNIDDNGISKGEGKGWDDKYWELPFGTNQLQANPNLKQHNGW
ncbi:MAG: RagB/SusD family nutrient uptake outer membrane protein, partial [Bacteroidales bacterium]